MHSSNLLQKITLNLKINLNNLRIHMEEAFKLEVDPFIDMQMALGIKDQDWIEEDKEKESYN